MSNKADFILIAGSPPSERIYYICHFEKSNNDSQLLSLLLDNLWASLRGRTDQMPKKQVCIKVLLWIGGALFLLCFVGSTLMPERVLPAVGLPEYDGFIIRLYGIFQLSWAFLFFLALKDVEKNMAIINSAIFTGALVVIYFVVCQFAAIKSGRYFLLNAALLLVYTVLLFLCKPRPKARA